MPTNCLNERSLGSNCHLPIQLQMMTVNDDHRAVCTDTELCLMLTCLHHELVDGVRVIFDYLSCCMTVNDHRLCVLK